MIQMPACHTKIFIKLYKSGITGYIITRKRNRQLKSHKLTAGSYISDPYQENANSIRNKTIYALSRIPQEPPEMHPKSVIKKVEIPCFSVANLRVLHIILLYGSFISLSMLLHIFYVHKSPST